MKQGPCNGAQSRNIAVRTVTEADKNPIERCNGLIQAKILLRAISVRFRPMECSES